MFDLDPPQGPTDGSTDVNIIGSNFEDTKFVQCKFGDMIVPGEYVSENNVKCVAPESPKAGKVPIQVAFQQGKWSAGNMEFLFYDTP